MTAYREFCLLRDQRRSGEEAPEFTEEEAFNRAVAQGHATLMATTSTYPGSLTEDLHEVLGMPNFRCAPIAHAYRDVGEATIPHKAEAEQAFVIDKLVRFVIQHGAGWRTHASAELGRIRDKLREQEAGAV
jgi:hypothetical protein